MATTREKVEFKTLDGLTLRGVLFPAKKHSPAVILAPGVSLDMLDPRASQHSSTFWPKSFVSTLPRVFEMCF